jgi:hypothetical protein
MDPLGGSNGASRAGLYLSIVIAALMLLGMIGSVFYVAFEVRADSVLIEAQSILIHTSQDELRSLQLKLNSLEVAMNEVETQFCADDQMRNIMHANDMRLQSLLWQKTYPGTTLPTDNAYYPTICNRKAKQD